MNPRSAAVLASLVLGVGLSGLTAKGTITGSVKYAGKLPRLKTLDMTTEPTCKAKHADSPAKSEALVLGEGNTMANIYVRVISGLPDREWETPKEPAVIDQNGCLYSPHVVAVMVDQPIKFLNSDGILHNLHALPEENDEFNVTMPKFLKETTRSFEYAESMFRIKCDVHPWMGGWVAVSVHPFFDVTGTDGSYSISGLGPGTYKIEAWHEKLGTQQATVTVSGDEQQTADFTFQR